MGNRARELSERIRKNSGATQNIGDTNRNLESIEKLVQEAYRAGLITEYDEINAYERQEISKYETDDIANAHRVKIDGDDKTYYISYKPQVNKNKNKQSKLEHVNRSTPFVEMLLGRVDTAYSFLFCHSEAQSSHIPLPPVADGFTVTRGQETKEGGQNKFELFLLIECKDEIAEATDSLKNIIDSVLIDVDDGSSGDLFAHLSYASLAHTTTDGGDFTPTVDMTTRNQLNNIIVEIRSSQETRQRLLDFLLQHKESKLYQHIENRNRAFCTARDRGLEVNAINSSVECHVSPIGVFLNEISNHRIPYTVKGSNGEQASFYIDVNPVTPFTGHVCPHCGKPLDNKNRLVAIATYNGGGAVGCTACAQKCVVSTCNRYTFSDGGCAVCGKAVCSVHAKKSIDSNDKLCTECANVFRDSVSNEPLAPRDACVRGGTEDFVVNELGRMGKTEAMNRFRGKLLRKKKCVLCRTRTEEKYYPAEETRKCDACNKSYYKDDVKKATDSNKMLCIFDRVDCSCGKVVSKYNALSCSESGCTNGFCKDCATKSIRPKGYAHAVKLLTGKPRPMDCDGKLYCPDHATVCKVCGKVVPLSQTRVCPDCGGLYCNACKGKDKCVTCATAEKVTATNYKQISSKTRAARLNALPFADKMGRTAVLEDNETLICVTVQKNRNHTRVFNKLTGKIVKGKK